MSRIDDTTHRIQSGWLAKEIIVNSFWFLAFAGISALIGSFPRSTDFQPEDVFGLWIIERLPGLFIGLFLFFPLYLLLRKMNYHYSLEDKFLVVEQGIFAKQKRHIPYASLQNVLLMRTFLDTLFGFVTVSIENASGVAGGMMPARSWYWRDRGRHSYLINVMLARMMGIFGNRVSIPGLSARDAVQFRDALLEKFQESRRPDVSGL